MKLLAKLLLAIDISQSEGDAHSGACEPTIVPGTHIMMRSACLTHHWSFLHPDYMVPGYHYP